jgi:hypothetical protein
MLVLLNLISAWLLADFIAGVGHWVQDRLLDIESLFNFVNSIKKDNDLHHEKPAAMLKNSLFENVRDSMIVAWPIAFVAWLAGAPLFLWLGVGLSSFANGVHRFSHMPPGRVPRPIKLLQRTGIFLSFNHHAGHHYRGGKVVLKENATHRYCVMTNWLNPILDGVKFWTMLEWVFKRRS